MSFCDRCGKQVAADALFCRNCGRRFQTDIPMAHVPPAHSDKEVIASTARRSQAAQVSKTGVVAETTKEERAGVPTSLVMVGAIASPVGAFLLLVLFQMGFSSWELLVYSYGLAVVTGILLLVIFPILGRVRKFRPVRANR